MSFHERARRDVVYFLVSRASVQAKLMCYNLYVLNTFYQLSKNNGTLSRSERFLPHSEMKFCDIGANEWFHIQV